MAFESHDQNLVLIDLVSNQAKIYYYLELSVAKRKACLQPEKTRGYQYLFTVQFFDSYVYMSRINKGH